MIINGVLLVAQGVLVVLLSPLEGLNIVVDFVASVPVVAQFIQFVGFIMPWTNLVPLFLLIFAIIGFRVVVAVIKTIWDLLPLV